MSSLTVFSIIESPTHPNFSDVYLRLNVDAIMLNSMRKAISKLKTTRPDYVVAEFFYGYGNNYAGVNISNLDVFLHSMQKYAPDAKVIVVVDKTEREYVDKLHDLFPLHAVLQHPVNSMELEILLKGS